MFTYKLTVRGLIIAAFMAATISISTPAQAQAPAEVRQALTHRRQQLRIAVDEAYAKFKGDTKGKNAGYIPYLAQLDSNLFGISVVTTDGQVYSVGDVNYSFSQSPVSTTFGFYMGKITGQVVAVGFTALYWQCRLAGRRCSRNVLFFSP